MGYIDRLDSTQKTNLDIIVKSFEKWGITNKYTQAGILAIISKESSFRCGFEKGYGNTSNDRIRKIFQSRVGKMSDAELSALKKDDVAFFNLIYGGRYGNAANEGFKYRGAGFNQITFKGNYAAAAKRTNVDLVSHPERIEDPNVAADAAITYFIDKFNTGFGSKHKAHYNSPGINGFSSLESATLAVYHANAGFAKSMYSVGKAESTGGLQKALMRAPAFLRFLEGSDFSFSSKSEGDAFRAWVNDNYPDYAKEINLDRSGSHTNSYIMRAWAKLGSEYKK